MEVPSSNDNQPRPQLPPVDQRFLLMAGAGMIHAAQERSAYTPGATFTDAELSKNVEDRRNPDIMQSLATMIDTVERTNRKLGKTPDEPTDEFGAGPNTRTPTDLSAFERTSTVTPR